MSMELHNIREEYRHGELDPAAMPASPFPFFAEWFDAARHAGLAEPNAMTLATASPAGRPSARIVLLKGFGDEGFSFYTNYHSRKGVELDANPFAALVFAWLELERQVRIEGTVSRLPEEESVRYFQSRPRGSQLGAWASAQSEVIPDRSVLETRLAELERRYEGEPVLPKPPGWGGYLLKPASVEFWQGRPSRLHDRIRYRLAGEEWVKERLAP
jgi:pyridoxamine 5'-phosphate oxidase